MSIRSIDRNRNRPLARCTCPGAEKSIRVRTGSAAAPGERWMHELGVAFVQRDKHGRGFLWSVNRLLPSQAGRAHSETLLTRFRELCEALEIEEGVYSAPLT